MLADHMSWVLFCFLIFTV